MTKETKIGLLVGLAFIILFAVILSEKGAATNPKPPTQLTRADASPTLAGADSEQTVENGGRLPLRPESAAPVEPENRLDRATVMIEAPVDPASGRQIPAEGEPIPALPETVVRRLNLAELDDEVPTQTGESVDADALSLNQAVQAALNPRIPEAGGTTESPQTPAVAARNDAGAPQATTPEKTVKILATHTVGKGESLGKIASRYYGRATRARVEAIFEANRDKLKSIHNVRSGDELVIPELTPAQNALFEPAASFAPAEIPLVDARARIESMRIPIPLSETSAATAPRTDSTQPPATKTVETPKPQPTTWYVVQENDTLSKIARRELGNERRFLEIYRLNKDVLPDKNTLRPGMKIRLPKGSDSALATSMVTE